MKADSVHYKGYLIEVFWEKGNYYYEITTPEDDLLSDYEGCVDLDESISNAKERIERGL